ncbi:hypothetical protein ACTGVI_12195, partial [Streptococcus suis]
MGMWRGRQDASDLADWFDRHAPDRPDALQKAVQDRSLRIVARLPGKSAGVPFEAEWCCPSQVADSTRKVREASPFMQAPMVSDQRGFALQTIILALRI